MSEEKKKENVASVKKMETAETEKPIAGAQIATKKVKKLKRQIIKGQAHISCSYNNTIVTISDLNGSVLGWSSAGLLGFKGAKKSTPYAATQAVKDLTEKVKKYGLQKLEVYVKGVGGGREASIRALVAGGFEITLIKDTTPIPHNGCRPPKPRRV